MNNKSYLILNKIFAGVILAIFLYSAFYSPQSDAHAIPCMHEQILGVPCPSCGMSHAFSALVRLQFNKANELQPAALPVFLFFMIQLFMRVAIIVAIRKPIFSIKRVMVTDIVISAALFLICFSQLISSTFRIFCSYF